MVSGKDLLKLAETRIGEKYVNVLTLEDPNMKGAIVRNVQRALEERGFNPGVIDCLYGPHTVAAVYAFQKAGHLVADGVVGPLTAKKSGIEWPA